MIKRLTKKFMMESWKKIKRVAGIGALGVASLVSPESAQASQLKIAQAQTEVDKAKFGVANAAPEEKKEAEKALVEARGKLNEARAEDRDEKKSAKPAPKSEIGVAPKNEAVIKMTHRMVDITDDKGNVIGRAEEGSKDWVKLEKQRIAANRAIEKEKAKSSRPVVYVDESERGYGVSDRGVNTGGGGWVEPYNNPGRGRYGFGGRNSRRGR